MRYFNVCLTLCFALGLMGAMAAVAQTTDQAGKTPETANADNGHGAAGEASNDTRRVILQLTDDQRQRIRAAIADDKTDISFKDDATKGEKDFIPKVGATLPAKLPMQPMPPSVAAAVRPVSNFSYVKLKGQVLIIDPISKKVVDMFPIVQG
jgi:hypothetical protein